MLDSLVIVAETLEAREEGNHPHKVNFVVALKPLIMFFDIFANGLQQF